MSGTKRYLPDDLYRRAREPRLPLSALTREAVESALRATDRQEWVARLRSRPRRVSGPVDAARVLADVREDFGR